MGWDVVEGGFKVVLSAKVPSIVTAHVRGDVDDFLAAQGLARGDIRHWIAHTGGPKVLQAFGRPHTDPFTTGPTHIFNLGHGISQFTPPDHVAALVAAVHAQSRALRGR